MNSDFAKLLEELKDINTNTDNLDTPNVFLMLGVENKEVLMCRMLKAIIEPNGVHGLGVTPLKLFLEELGIEIDEEVLKKSYVELEEVIDGERRVDIAIHIDNKVIPIEAKINSADQPNQLYDYYYYYKNKGNIINQIFYLTPLEKKPSQESLVNLKVGEQVKTITFSDNIYDYLERILKIEALNSEFKFIIKNYKEVIKNMGQESKNKYNVISKVEKMVESDNELKKALLQVLKYGDDIRAILEQSYFNESLRKNEKYKNYTVEILEDDLSSFKNIDKHSKYKIVKDKTIVAYLCIETNLYIARKFESGLTHDGWINYPESDYAWRYIYKSNNQKWRLKDIDINIFNYSIAWDMYLS